MKLISSVKNSLRPCSAGWTIVSILGLTHSGTNIWEHYGLVLAGPFTSAVLLFAQPIHLLTFWTSVLSLCLREKRYLFPKKERKKRVSWKDKDEFLTVTYLLPNCIGATCAADVRIADGHGQQSDLELTIFSICLHQYKGHYLEGVVYT